MPAPALFPSPFGGTYIRTFRSLQEWTGSGWRCVQYEPGCQAFFSEPQILQQYDGRDEYGKLQTVVSPPFLLASLWYLGQDNRWYQHRYWSNRSPDLAGRWAGDPL